MVTSAVGAVVVVRFPYSNLTNAKLRPAIVLAGAGQDDWVLCQITSQPYADSSAIKIESADFSSGLLHKTSYARPAKIFTVNSEIMAKHIGNLSHEKFNEIVRLGSVII